MTAAKLKDLLIDKYFALSDFYKKQGMTGHSIINYEKAIRLIKNKKL